MPKETVDQEIMAEVAKELGIPKSIIKDVIVDGQSAFTKHIIERGHFEGVRWPYLGSFQVKAKYASVKIHMKGMAPVFRAIFQQRILNGSVFEKKFKSVIDINNEMNDTI